MSYLILGSSGHTSKVVAEKLLSAGKEVTVIGRNPENLKSLTDKGAKAEIGSLEDAAFLKKAFKGKKAVYAMIPPNYQTDNVMKMYHDVADNIVNAVKENGVEYVVLLSSFGAHLRKGAGIVDSIAYFETLLEALPNVHSKMLRPGSFYYNFYNNIPLLKTAGILGSNYDGQTVIPFVDTTDIGEAAAEELLHLNFTGKSVRYIVSDEMTAQQAATILGEAIGKPDLQWVQFPDDQLKAGLMQAGLKEDFADGMIELGQALQTGKMQEDYFKHKPATTGSHKFKDFAKSFAAAYSAK